MASRCPACGAGMDERPSFSGSVAISWLRCNECGHMELVEHHGGRSGGELLSVLYDFERLAGLGGREKFSN